jgi:hypothetical protein
LMNSVTAQAARFIRNGPVPITRDFLATFQFYLNMPFSK